MKADAASRDLVRQICERFPEVEMTAAGQHLRFSVRNKTFAYYLEDHHGDGITALCCKASPAEKEALLRRDRQRFYSPAYLGARGWLAVRLDLGDEDWREIAELAAEAYLLTAPKRLAARLREAL